MLNLRFMIVAILAAATILLAGIQIIGSNITLIASIIGDKPRIDGPIAQRPPQAAPQRIVTPAKPPAPTEITGSITKVPDAAEIAAKEQAAAKRAAAKEAAAKEAAAKETAAKEAAAKKAAAKEAAAKEAAAKETAAKEAAAKRAAAKEAAAKEAAAKEAAAKEAAAKEAAAKETTASIPTAAKPKPRRRAREEDDTPAFFPFFGGGR